MLSAEISVLIVDDQPANLILMKHFIGNEGYQIVTAPGGKEALDELYKQHFDIVFLDIMMPGMNGIDVLKHIKADPSLMHVYVIMVSAIIESEELAKALEFGASDYIKRPINKIELIARLNAIIRIKRQEDELRFLNEQLESKNKIISESIKSASIIQKSLFPRENVLYDTYPGSYIYLKPKSLVSGDFFWIGKNNNREIIIGADCTGHGVAGAMLAIIANIIINQIVINSEIVDSSEFLRLLNIEYSEALNRYNDDIENYLLDGMDISIAIIDRVNDKISLSAASQNMFVFFKNNTLELLLGDESSIGYEINGKYVELFSTYEFKLDDISGFVFYSDGVVDQHGGDSKNTKFGQAKLKALLETEGQKDAHALISRSIKEWQNENSQTDDILYLSVIL